MHLVQMATAPEAIEFFMALFCNTTRIVLLMEKVPWKLLVQVSVVQGIATQWSLLLLSCPRSTKAGQHGSSALVDVLYD